ncbi:hypothetical protein PGT21_023420 [Puccinia graminis f. sp. tritici]|uniref:Uncharacterized protein n=1 Tax=Puccinia graminis f. sp. tritici TaxID=56615 RepID=A0A5B0NEZ5_PUCGR|nr:hypothetical protein PGT21_023420 [Puccinia graminis f. sp. tritici]
MSDEVPRDSMGLETLSTKHSDSRVWGSTKLGGRDYVCRGEEWNTGQHPRSRGLISSQSGTPSNGPPALHDAGPVGREIRLARSSRPGGGGAPGEPRFGAVMPISYLAI